MWLRCADVRLAPKVERLVFQRSVAGIEIRYSADNTGMAMKMGLGIRMGMGYGYRLTDPAKR